MAALEDQVPKPPSAGPAIEEIFEGWDAADLKKPNFSQVSDKFNPAKHISKSLQVMNLQDNNDSGSGGDENNSEPIRLEEADSEVDEEARNAWARANGTPSRESWLTQRNRIWHASTLRRF